VGGIAHDRSIPPSVQVNNETTLDPLLKHVGGPARKAAAEKMIRARQEGTR
jgi:hypothetical protein